MCNKSEFFCAQYDTSSMTMGNFAISVLRMPLSCATGADRICLTNEKTGSRTLLYVLSCLSIAREVANQSRNAVTRRIFLATSECWSSDSIAARTTML